MKKVFVFASVLIMVIALMPLGGVSAQRPAPVSSASLSAAPAPAAAVTYYKQIKTQFKMYYGGAVAFKYVQKLYWGYDYNRITTWAATMKGKVFQPAYVSYSGYSLISTAGGVNYPYYYRWTYGTFWWNPTATYYYLHIEQEVYDNGTWWKNKFYHSS